MGDRVFVIMQIGAEDSPERKRADEVYQFIVVPTVEAAGVVPYRADLDYSPGAITPKFISELLAARLIIADLTNRNPNVFYELGIAHSFVRPLILLADSSGSLPFDAKDERIIAIGDYPPTGLGHAQVQKARASLHESLKIVLADDYLPPSPLRDAAGSLSLDRLAPDNPMAAELAQMREILEEVRKKVTPRTVAVVPKAVQNEIALLRDVIEMNVIALDESDFSRLDDKNISPEYSKWLDALWATWNTKKHPDQDPWASDTNQPNQDPWASDSSGFSDEPPF